MQADPKDGRSSSEFAKSRSRRRVTSLPQKRSPDSCFVPCRFAVGWRSITIGPTKGKLNCLPTQRKKGGSGSKPRLTTEKEQNRILGRATYQGLGLPVLTDRHVVCWCWKCLAEGGSCSFSRLFFQNLGSSS